MKYGLRLNPRNKIKIENALEFIDDRKGIFNDVKNPNWIELPKKKVLICFEKEDKYLAIALKKTIELSELLNVIDINITQSFEPDLMLRSLNECNFYIPILSSHSIQAQWLNQAFDFVKSKENEIMILPFIDVAVVDSLEEFLDKNSGISHQFRITGFKRNDKLAYRKTCKLLVEFMESRILAGHDIKPRKRKSS